MPPPQCPFQIAAGILDSVGLLQDSESSRDALGAEVGAWQLLSSSINTEAGCLPRDISIDISIT